MSRLDEALRAHVARARLAGLRLFTGNRAPLPPESEPASTAERHLAAELAAARVDVARANLELAQVQAQHAAVTDRIPDQDREPPV